MLRWEDHRVRTAGKVVVRANVLELTALCAERLTSHGHARCGPAQRDISESSPFASLRLGSGEAVWHRNSAEAFLQR